MQWNSLSQSSRAFLKCVLCPGTFSLALWDFVRPENTDDIRWRLLLTKSWSVWATAVSTSICYIHITPTTTYRFKLMSLLVYLHFKILKKTETWSTVTTSSNIKLDAIVDRINAPSIYGLVDTLDVLHIDADRNCTITSRTENLSFVSAYLQSDYAFPESHLTKVHDERASGCY